VGSSAAAIHLRQTIVMTQGTVLPSHLNLESTIGDWMADERGRKMIEPMVQAMMGSQENAAMNDALGTDMSVFFRDLPLTVMLAFQGASLQGSPQEIVMGMIAGVNEAV
jgi:hypothetical protein